MLSDIKWGYFWGYLFIENHSIKAMLTELGCKNFKPKDKAYKKFDGGGVFLLIKSNGHKYWHLKYRIAGKEKLLALGVYPEISLSVKQYPKYVLQEN